MAHHITNTDGSEAMLALDKAVHDEFDSTLFLSRSNRIPIEEEISLIKIHFGEDMRELDTLDTRIVAEAVRITQETHILGNLRIQLEAIKRKHGGTVHQLKIELDAQTSFEQFSLEYARNIRSSTFYLELLTIQSEFVERSQIIISKSIQVLQAEQESELETISQLENSLKAGYACMGLLLGRKELLEARREDLVGSIAKTRALMGCIRRFPTEILVQIFLLTLDLFISSRTQHLYSRGSHPVLAIIRVCKRWRDIAMDTAGLWRYIPIYGLPLTTSPALPLMQIKMISERVALPSDLFIDCTRLAQEPMEYHEERWSELLGYLGRLVNLAARRQLHPAISLHFSSTAPVLLDMRSFPLEKYILYNIYPESTPNPALGVTSIVLYFNQRPKKQPLLDILQEFPNLTNFEVHLFGFSYLQTPYTFGHVSCPPLKRLSVRLSLMPYFLNDRHAVSRSISSLNIYCDQPSHHIFMTPEQWASTVQLGKLCTGLRHLGLEGLVSANDAVSHAVPLLLGLRRVVTLALCGKFLAPILEKLAHEHSLLPILCRLEMRGTDVDESVIEKLLNSRRESPQSLAVPVRELLLNHCGNITRDFCDRIRGCVEKLTVYS